NIPSKYFMKSDACQRCHADIYKQWDSSMHHFSSFNNQWYRKSIEYMQDVAGVRSSKWCAGCHDPALLYSGLFDTPIKQIVDRPEARAGLGCLMCHSIVEVKSTMGQGDFFLEYPKLHELAASENPFVRKLHDFVVRLNPEPHRRTFLKPFMRADTAEFCSSGHKVHLDVLVNRYRWISSSPCIFSRFLQQAKRPTLLRATNLESRNSRRPSPSARNRMLPYPRAPPAKSAQLRLLSIALTRPCAAAMTPAWTWSCVPAK